MKCFLSISFESPQLQLTDPVTFHLRSYWFRITHSYMHSVITGLLRGKKKRCWMNLAGQATYMEKNGQSTFQGWRSLPTQKSVCPFNSSDITWPAKLFQGFIFCNVLSVFHSPLLWDTECLSMLWWYWITLKCAKGTNSTHHPLAWAQPVQPLPTAQSVLRRVPTWSNVYPVSPDMPPDPLS